MACGKHIAIRNATGLNTTAKLEMVVKIGAVSVALVRTAKTITHIIRSKTMIIEGIVTAVLNRT